MTVYCIFPEGVSKHEPLGVYSTKRRALAAAKRMWARSDGYHALIVKPFQVDVDYADNILSGWRSTPTTTSPSIFVEDEPEVLA